MSDHLTAWKHETHVGDDERVWLIWADRTSQLLNESGFSSDTGSDGLPHRLDGMLSLDGFGLDDAYKQWTAGTTPEGYLAMVRARRGSIQMSPEQRERATEAELRVRLAIIHGEAPNRHQ
ncbi:hypothetical protein [Nesterenkonia rhizosphaerae]|uniref:Uncharacterized protein n=1 Tax=Nesterenkonia rhizosphaerae TaxID=1348272 RepID=A0ABP9G0G6_9MICC